MKNSEWKQAFIEIATAYYKATGDLFPDVATAKTIDAVRTALVTDEIVADLYGKGITMHKIAEMLGCSEGTVCNRLKRAGVQIRSSADYQPTEAQVAAREKLKSAHKSPKSWERIAQMSREKRKQHGYEFGGAERKRPNGYIMVYAPEHPRANRAREVPKHTLVMERHLGRYLTDAEVVHHINKVRDDNRIENLVVMDRSEHLKMHAKKENAG